VPLDVLKASGFPLSCGLISLTGEAQPRRGETKI